MRLILFAALTACASAPRKPRADCTYLVKTTLTEKANEKCHTDNKPGWSWKGKLVGDVYGCAGNGRILSNGTQSNIGHENMHIIEQLCPEWAEGYFGK